MDPMMIATSSTAYGSLLDIVALLGELTAHEASLPEIPRVLVSLLPVDRVEFSIVCATAAESDRVLVAAGCDTGDDSSISSVVARAMPSDSSDAPATDASAEVDQGEDRGTRGALYTGPDGQIRRRVAMVRKIDATHQMVLVLFWGKRLSAMSDELGELANAICKTLVRLLGVLLSWREQPDEPGGDFSRISPVEWRILRHLNTDLSEKELASALITSPHTLHSHIKSIYKKLGVRNRLSAIHLLRQAAQHYRIRAVEWTGIGLKDEGEIGTTGIATGKIFSEIRAGHATPPSCFQPRVGSVVEQNALVQV